MTNTYDKKIWILFLIASVSLVLALSANDIYAIHETADPDNHDMHEDTSHDSYFTDANPEPPAKKTMMAYPTVHDMSLVVVYDSTQGVLHSKDFTYYSQISGFDRSKTYGEGTLTQTKPSFIIEGVVTPKHHMLYEMVDYVWEQPSIAYQTMYSQNDFYIGLVQDEMPVRVFKYTDCKVTDYKVDTLYDGVFTYDPNGGSGRAFVDKFTFECDGFKPLNEAKVKEAKTDIMAKLKGQSNGVKKSGNGSPISEKATKSITTSQVLPQYGTGLK